MLASGEKRREEKRKERERDQPSMKSIDLLPSVLMIAFIVAHGTKWCHQPNEGQEGRREERRKNSGEGGGWEGA